MIGKEQFVETLQESGMPFDRDNAYDDDEAHDLYLKAKDFRDTYWDMFCYESNPESWLDVENTIIHILENRRDYRHDCDGYFTDYCSDFLMGLRDYNYVDRNNPYNLFRQRRNRRYRWEAPLLTKESNTFIENPYNHLVGLEIELTDDSVDEHIEEHEVADTDGDLKWDCVHDGSISMGSEFRLRTITNGDKLLNEISSFCKIMKNKGYGIDNSCGVHMHIDFRNGNLTKLKKIINFYSRYEQFIYDVVGEDRKGLRFSQALRKTHSDGELYSSPSEFRFGPLADAMNSANLREFKKDYYQTEHYEDAQYSKYYDGRYSGVNVHSVFLNGTLELRHLRGTINENYIRNWVMFNLHVVDKFMRHNTTSDEVILLHSNQKPTKNEFYGWLDEGAIDTYKKLKNSFKYEVNK